MITLKQYDRLERDINSACISAATRNTSFEILMTGELYREIFDVFDVIKHTDGERTYYYCGHPVKRINALNDSYEWWIVFKGGRLE